MQHFQIKLPGKPPAEVQVVGGPDDADNQSTCSSDNRLVFDNSAFVEAPIHTELSDDGSSSVNSQPIKADECDAWLPMDTYDLGFLSEMPFYEEDARSEVAVEDPGPWALGMCLF